MSRLTIVLAIAVAVVMAAGAPFAADSAVAAKGSKGLVACPAKVGGYKLEDVRARPGAQIQQQSCTYDHRKKPGWVTLHVSWHMDEQGGRGQCDVRQPRLTADEDFGSPRWVLASATKSVGGSIVTSEAGGKPKISLADAEVGLRRLLTAAEPLAHPCVPDAQPVAEGLSCPLSLPHDLVRTDWYVGEAQVVEVLGDGSDDRYGLNCVYKPAYSEDGDVVSVKLEWKEGDPGGSILCTARVKEFYHSTKHQLGYHPVSVDISNEFVERWDGQSLADALVTAAVARTQRCPDAPAGLAPYEEAIAATPPADVAGAISIVLSGGPGDEPPSIGSTIDLPEDEQHQLVIGGPNGEVIREEFLGDRGTITGYGPLAADAEGNWSVLADVEVSVASQAPVTPTPSPVPSAVPVATVTPVVASPSPQPSVAPVASESAGSSTSEPAAEPSPATGPTASPAPPASPTAVPPPELIGVPEGVAGLIAELPPKGAGALRNVTDHVAVLGEMLEADGQGEVTVPASDIAALKEVVPDWVTEVRPISGSIRVSSGKLKVLVTPIIGANGLIEVRLSTGFGWVESHELVRALVAALNGYVAEGGGRFRTISVTPEGLTVTADAPAAE